MMAAAASSLAATTLALWRNIATARWATAQNKWEAAFAALDILHHIERLGATPALRQSATSAIASLGRDLSRDGRAAPAQTQKQERRP